MKGDVTHLALAEDVPDEEAISTIEDLLAKVKTGEIRGIAYVTIEAMVHYGRIFDRCSLIAAPKHLELATSLLPEWWGISELRTDGMAAKLRVVREGGLNRGVDSKAIARLLRRSEADAVLLKEGIFAPLRRGSRKAFGEAVHSMISLPKLKAAVVAAVAARGDGTGHGL